MNKKGIDFEKYDKIYRKKGVMKKAGGFEGKYGDNEVLDKKWDSYGHKNEGRPNFYDLILLMPESIIDVGCGHNEFLNMVRRNEVGFIGSSIRMKGVDIACPSADVIAPAHNMPFEDSSYDMIVSFDCMEHIPEEEVELSYREFSRIADRIYLKICLTHSETTIDDQPVHVCVKSKEWWLELSKKYFPNAEIRRHERVGQPGENITIYGDNRKDA